MNIPFSPPFIDQAVINEVLDSLHSNWITSGPKVKALEAEILENLPARRLQSVLTPGLPELS